MDECHPYVHGTTIRQMFGFLCWCHPHVHGISRGIPESWTMKR
jgi:hypothetical protein